MTLEMLGSRRVRSPGIVVGMALVGIAVIGLPISGDTGAWPPAPSCDTVEHQRRIDVSDARSLDRALDDALPGDLIVARGGDYHGTFRLDSDGIAGLGITLCTSQRATIDGGSREGGYGLHITGDHWTVLGFRIRNVNKGIVLDGARYADLARLEIYDLGQEAVHFRKHSTFNVLRESWIHDTGKLIPEYGEGVYIGSAESNWCRYTDCHPDRADDNEVLANRIGPNVTAESIDVKEGTSGGVIRGNVFDGSGMTAADSWVDVKGDDYLVALNTGRRSPLHGFQVHEREGFGHRTTFAGNRAEVHAEGFGFDIASGARGTVILCDNEVRDAGGWANIPCDRHPEG